MTGSEVDGRSAEIARMQRGLKTLVSLTADSGHGWRQMSSRAFLSLLCAAAFAPLLAVGVTGAAAVAGIQVLASLGGGVLSSVLVSACDRLRSDSERAEGSDEARRERIAQQIEQALGSENPDSPALLREIVSILSEVGAGQVLTREAMDSGNELILQNMLVEFSSLGGDLAETRTLIQDVRQATAAIVRKQDARSAESKAQYEQLDSRLIGIREAIDDLTDVALSERSGVNDIVAGRRKRWVHRCPYRGLEPFRETDAEVFYGRRGPANALATMLGQRLTRGGIVAVTGPSGAGKSSLLRAGLVPLLRRGGSLPGSEQWPRVVMAPSGDPLAELATRLAVLSGGGMDTDWIRDELAGSPEQAHVAIRQLVLAHARQRASSGLSTDEEAARLVLIIDQFEQLTFAEEGSTDAQRQQFVTAVLNAAARWPSGSGGPAALVVLAVRGDHWHRCAEAFPQLAGQLEDGRFPVSPMSESDLVSVITGPAVAAGLRIEPGLTDVILGDLRVTGTGSAAVLPLLSQAMLLTWEQREAGQLTIRGFEQTGGISRAVEASADKVYDGLPAEAQPLARGMFRMMTAAASDGVLTSRSARRSDLYAAFPGDGQSRIDAVLEAFAGKRLLVLNEHTAEIAHDALLTGWPRLTGWLREDQENWRLHRQLGDAAAHWDEHGRDASDLYGSHRLVAIAEARTLWSAEPGFPALTPLERDFLRESEHAVRRRASIRRLAISTLATVTVLAVVAAAGLIVSVRRLSQERSQAIYNQVTAEALQLSPANTSLAAQLDLTAYHIDPTPDAATRLIDFENTPLPTPLTGLAAAVDSMAFSRNGRVLASSGDDGTVSLWSVTDPAHPVLLGPPLTVATGTAGSVALSPGGGILVTGSGDGAVRLWNVADPRHPAALGEPLAGSAGKVDTVTFSPGGGTLASGGDDGTIRLWNIADPAAPRQMEPPLTASAGALDSVAFSPDGQVLASGGSDGTLRLWDAADPAHLRPASRALSASAGAVTAVTFSPDGRIMANAGSDGTLRLWDVANPASPQPFGSPLIGSTGAVNTVAFSPDGQILATGARDGAVRLWDVANPTDPQLLVPPLTGPAGAVSSVVFSPDGRTLAVGDADHSIWLWSLPQTILTGNTASVASVAFSPNGRILASGGTDQSARLWNVTNSSGPQPIGGALTGSAGTVASVAFSPASRMLAAGGYDGTARLWDVTDPEHPRPAALLPINVPQGYVYTVAFSPNGQTLALGGSSHAVQLWDVADPARPQPLGPPLQANDDVASVAFSPDGRTLASGSYDGTVRLWDIADPGRPWQLGPPLAGPGGYVLSVAFGPGGHTVAAGSQDGMVRLWEVVRPADPQPLGPPLTASAGAVSSVAFSRNGILATGGSDGTVRLWDAAGPAAPQAFGQPLTGSGSPVTSVAFSPDGRTLASGNYDGTIRLWNVNIAAAIRRICQVAGNALTPGLWHKYVGQLPYQPPCATAPPGKSASSGPMPAPPNLALATPGNVTATAAGQRAITVTWTEASGDATGFNIDNGCPVVPVGACGGSDASLTRTTGRTTSATFAVTPGTYQCFRVQAFSQTGESAWSPFTPSSCTATPALAVPATREWTDTGVNLAAGGRLFIRASGLVHVGPDTPVGPAGRPGCTPLTDHSAVRPAYPAPTLPCWSLIARIGNGPPFEVGSSTVVIATAGRLYLGLNDSSFAGNSGHWTVNIKIGGPPP